MGRRHIGRPSDPRHCASEHPRFHLHRPGQQREYPDHDEIWNQRNERRVPLGRNARLARFRRWQSDNSFYNPDNPPYFDSTQNPPVIDHDGVPDLLATYGNASFTEILHWGGTATNYGASFKFRIHGHVAPGSIGYAVLLVQTMGQTDFWALPSNFSGAYEEIWSSRRFPAGIGTAQPVIVTFLASFTANTQHIPEGSGTTGTYDFGSTITLDTIVVSDEDGNPVDGWTLETASGSAYETENGSLPASVFEDGFETQAVVPARLAPDGIASGQCRQLMEVLATLHASRRIAEPPVLACAPAER